MKLNLVLNYKKLAINTDLSSTGMQQAVQQFVGPAFVYELIVHPDNLMHARNILVGLNIDGVENPETQKIDLNPLRPQVNLHTSDKLGLHEWVIGHADIMAGSPGVG